MLVAMQYQYTSITKTSSFYDAPWYWNYINVLFQFCFVSMVITLQNKLHYNSVPSKVQKMRNLRTSTYLTKLCMILRLVKSCWIGSKTLIILAQNNSLFPKPVFSTKIKAILSKVVKMLEHFSMKILFGHFHSC